LVKHYYCTVQSTMQIEYERQLRAVSGSL
jgi:hypothetical protein